MSASLPDFAAAQARGALDFVMTDVATLQRLTRFPATEPWWGATVRYRFDDPLGRFGVSYAAESLDVAFAETVIHEIASFEDGGWLVPLEDIAERWVVRYQRPDPMLKLLDLTGAALKRLGLNNDVCAAGDYAYTQRLSRAVHEQVPQADGISYVSRQLNTRKAVALFERSGVRCVQAAEPLESHPDLARLIKLFGVQLI
ncbi:RES family NAD+ phosphorylase [Telluria sp. B2]